MTTSQALPPVACMPWCADGTGHTEAEEPEDQFCRSARHAVELGPAPEHLGGNARGDLLVHLYRDVYRVDGSGATGYEPPHIELGGSDFGALRLSTSEARKLGELLIELADTAEQPVKGAPDDVRPAGMRVWQAQRANADALPRPSG
jgi:hypothetical protein